MPAAGDVDLYGDLFTEHGESETLLKARIAEVWRLSCFLPRDLAILRLEIYCLV
jgi:hypothetical protein